MIKNENEGGMDRLVLLATIYLSLLLPIPQRTLRSDMTLRKTKL